MFDASPRPELLSLLAAVKADPDDDTAKFVLADWLQEQDSEADRSRGEYVRLVTEAARRGEREIPKSAVDLWTRHEKTWLSSIPRTWGGNWVDGALAVPPLLSAMLTRKHNAKLAGKVANTEAYAWVGGTALMGFTSQRLIDFGRSPLFKSLCAVSLLNYGAGVDSLPEFVRSSHSIGLRRLHLHNLPLTAEDTRALIGSAELNRLISVVLDTVQLGDAGFKALCGSSNLPELRSLSVQGNGLSIHSARAFADATGLQKLTELNLGGLNRIGPDGTLILVASPNSGRLRKLNLWANGIADYGVEAICRQSHMCNLTHLDLSGNLLTDRAARALAAAEHLKTLEVLILNTNEINSEGALALADSPQMANLRRLELTGNRLGDQAKSTLRERFGDRVIL